MAISRVQSKANNSSGSLLTTINVVLDSTLTVGNIVVVSAATLGLGSAPIQGTGITWLYSTINGTNSTTGVLAIGKVLSGASTTITVNGPSGGIAAVAAEYSGTNLMVDVYASSTGGGTSVASGTTGTTANANSLIVSAMAARNEVTFSSPTNSHAIVGQTASSSDAAAIKGVTDKFNTAMEQNGSNYRFTTAALVNAPSGGDASGLDPETVEKLNNSDQILLVELFTPNEVPNVVIPDPPSEESMCRVYGYVVKADGTLAVGTKVTFTLRTVGAAKGTRIIASRVIETRTDDEGRISDGTNGYIDLIRTDSITPSGAVWEINGPDLKITGKQVQLTTETFDIASVVS